MRKPAGSITCVSHLAHTACTDAAARDEPGAGVVNRVQAELPHPIKAAHVPHIQHECAIRFDDGHRPAWASPERTGVADGEVLKLRE